MGSFHQLLHALERHTQPASTPAALATVTAVQGSNFRRPGARMVIAADGQRHGVISGGCLEQDISQRIRSGIAGGAPITLRYDSTAPEEIVLGLGLGCDGIVDILIEPLPDANGAVRGLTGALASGAAGALATIVACPDGTAELGEHLFMPATGHPLGRLSSPDVATLAPRLLSELNPGGVVTREVQAAGGPRVLLLEQLLPPQEVVVFGASAVAAALVRQGVELGWRVTVADFRPGLIHAEDYPGAQTAIVEPEQIDSLLSASGGTALVLCTHNYLRDLAALRTAVSADTAYLGVVGSRQRMQRMRGELETGANRIYSPAGLDIGAESPEEVAVSIVAEIRAVVTGRAGGALRDSPQPIHPR